MLLYLHWISHVLRIKIGSPENKQPAIRYPKRNTGTKVKHFMKVSQTGIDLIASFEGLRLDAYPDPGSADGIPWTIGYGCTVYPDGTKVKKGDTISKENALRCLEYDVVKRADVINQILSLITVTQNQFDALVSFVYNIGVGGFKKSTLLKKVKADPNDPEIRKQFMRWNKNAGRIMAGLTRRRQAEADLYFK